MIRHRFDSITSKSQHRAMIVRSICCQRYIVIICSGGLESSVCVLVGEGRGGNLTVHKCISDHHVEDFESAVPQKVYLHCVKENLQDHT